MVVVSKQRTRLRVPVVKVILGGLVLFFFLFLFVSYRFIAIMSPTIRGGGPVAVNRISGKPIEIAHVISLASCAQKPRQMPGYIDALMVLRHSIHQNSVHAGKSKYSYKMYAIVHEDGGCDDQMIPLLRRLGYTPLIKPTPVNITAIEHQWYRETIDGTGVVGSKEFIKLYVYTLTDHPLAVHWDLDMAVLTPMDDLFDAMLYDRNSAEGRAARQSLKVQHPGHQQIPDRIDAFFTRDVATSRPTDNVQVAQGGFLVTRPDLDLYERYRQTIMEANYSKGCGNTAGWGGLGYGCKQGAMSYQGIVAYFYDHLYKDHAVELDVCRWNQVVADVIWRGPGLPEHIGECRQQTFGMYESNTPEKGACEDCRLLPIEETRTAHYTACGKPWQCKLKEDDISTKTCGLLFNKYFSFRKDLEDRITKLVGKPVSTPTGKFHPEYFLGFCDQEKYHAMNGLPDDFDLRRVYGF